MAITRTKPMKWYDILATLLESKVRRIMLIGPPGTGKSTSAHGAVRLTLTPGTGVEDLLGMLHLKAGETVWVDGPAARALRKGERLVLDEIDHASAEVASLLYALLDDSPQVTLPNGEQLTAADGYQVVGTTNSVPSVLPEAILDRFDVILTCDTPHPAAIAHLNKKQQTAVGNYYRSRVSAGGFKWDRPLTVRQARAFAALSSVLDEELAASVVFGTAAREILSVMAQQ